MFCTHILDENLRLAGNSRREEKRERVCAELHILTDNPPPPSSSVDNSLQDVYNKKKEIICAPGWLSLLTEMK